ncbi:MAG: hypothetical protein COT84_05990 [Chlamydiae bacterium CG10_big_fil_rev_8_21_14_0_10_35_9]|nr:MAG: hypothetical protein COT84_05990 [Chlamydiae bacterium CG10_big_fil_rev_8_21_14_0_10_35_9]
MLYKFFLMLFGVCCSVAALDLMVFDSIEKNIESIERITQILQRSSYDDAQGLYKFIQLSEERLALINNLKQDLFYLFSDFHAKDQYMTQRLEMLSELLKSISYLEENFDPKWTEKTLRDMNSLKRSFNLEVTPPYLPRKKSKYTIRPQEGCP